jgi:molybdopterin converting factor small subunit
MTTIRIPPALRTAVGSREVQAQGSTVGEVLSDFARQYPPLRDQIFDEEGDLRPFVNVYLNEQDISYLEKLNTAAGSSDTIIILPAMAGGRVGRQDSWRDRLLR